MGEINLFCEFRQGLVPDSAVEDAAGNFDALLTLVAFGECDRAIMGGLISSGVSEDTLDCLPGYVGLPTQGGIICYAGQSGIAFVVEGHGGRSLQAQIEVFLCRVVLRRWRLGYSGLFDR